MPYFAPVPDLEKHIDEWLHLLENEQRKAKSLGFPAGSIPSYRVYPLVKVRRADPNVFFPALIAVKLNEWRALMTTDQVARANDIVKGIADTFPLYKSRRGRIHYNFWPTSPDVPFPNGRWLHQFDFFRLPDDIDDTALVYGALCHDREVVESLQADVERHLTTFYPEKPTIYAAWLGDKMPWVTDACAMVNLLSLFRAHGLTSTEFMAHTDAQIERIITEGSYVKAPYQSAPYYPDTAVIAYHLSKWLAETGGKSSHAPLFKNTVRNLLRREKNAFRAMLYSICLFRLDEKPTDASAPLSIAEKDMSYPWFCGAMLSAVKAAWLRRLGGLGLFQIRHVCPAWNRTLWLEYHILKEYSESHEQH